MALLWVQRGRLDPTQWFLFGGALAGILTFLIIDQPSDGNQYFARTGYTYSVILSVWGFALLLDRRSTAGGPRSCWRSPPACSRCCSP